MSSFMKSSGGGGGGGVHALRRSHRKFVVVLNRDRTIFTSIIRVKMSMLIQMTLFLKSAGSNVRIVLDGPASELPKLVLSLFLKDITNAYNTNPPCLLSYQ